MVKAELFAYDKHIPSDDLFAQRGSRGQVAKGMFDTAMGGYFLDTATGEWVAADGWENWARQFLNDHEYGVVVIDHCIVLDIDN